MLAGRDTSFGHRIVVQALAQRGQNLVCALARRGDEKNVPKASFIVAILLRELRERAGASRTAIGRKSVRRSPTRRAASETWRARNWRRASTGSSSTRGPTSSGRD